MIFDKNDARVLKLCESDERLGFLIGQVGKNYFSSLVRMIIGQQLSIKATESIWSRVQDVCGNITPEVVYCMAQIT